MNFFEVECIGLIFILFPLYVYLFYTSYHIDLGKKDNNLFLDFALFSSFYLSMRFTSLFASKEAMFLMNIVLLLAYIQKRAALSLLLSLFCIFYYKIYFSFSLLVLIGQYLLFFFVYILYKNEKIKKITFCYLFLLLEIISIFIHLYLFSYLPGMDEKETLLHIALVILFFSFGALTSFFLFESGESIARYQRNIEKLKEETKIRDSLFRITHEIKNPIAVCKGYLDMMHTKKENHTEKYIPIIQKEIDRTLLLLEDFLCMNKIKIEKEEIDITLLLEEIIVHFGLLLKENNIKSSFMIPDDEIYLYGDYNRLMQVLINLVKNSIESLEGKEYKRISIYTRKEEKYFSIWIEDNGCGMTKEQLEKIKEPFYTTKQRGTGLGVSLSEEIIKAHHGSLQYKSEYLKGTTVEVCLPILPNT